MLSLVFWYRIFFTGGNKLYRGRWADGIVVIGEPPNTKKQLGRYQRR